jgi:phenolic acid decarboxylase
MTNTGPKVGHFYLYTTGEGFTWPMLVIRDDGVTVDGRVYSGLVESPYWVRGVPADLLEVLS